MKGKLCADGTLCSPNIAGKSQVGSLPLVNNVEHSSSIYVPRGPPQAYEISNLAKDFQISRKISQISRFQERFPDFQISRKIS